MNLTAWLLDSDPALQWQVERDIVGESLPLPGLTKAIGVRGES